MDWKTDDNKLQTEKQLMVNKFLANLQYYKLQ